MLLFCCCAGIETATADLQRENDERLWQEGILRHVPIFSSVYNWLSPPPPPGIKGRTLDLTAGVLESTENIYRYHMQVMFGIELFVPGKVWEVIGAPEILALLRFGIEVFHPCVGCLSSPGSGADEAGGY